MLGISPATSAKANNVQIGQRIQAAAARPISARKVTNVVGTRTADWPFASTQRDTCGETKALASAKVAETAPASQYSPCVWESMATAPIVVIGSGSRATKAAAEKPFVPGLANISR